MYGLDDNPFLDKDETALEFFKPKVLPIVWDTGKPLHPSLRDGLKLFYSRTPFFEVSTEDTLCGTNIDELLREALKRRYLDWACVIGMGNIFSSQNKVVSEVEEFVSKMKEDVLVCGHLINKPGYYCGIHEQFFLVNLRTYERLGCPEFGSYRAGVKELQDYRAGESIHDDYTPTWVAPLPGRSEYRTGTCGWGFVDASLKNGLRVLNLSESVRRTKLFMYPDDENEKLNRNIELLYQLEDLANPSQRAALAHMLLRRLNLTHAGGLNYRERNNCLFFFNTEFILPHENWNPEFDRPIDVYAGPCSGVQDVVFSHVSGFHENTEVHYFDISDAALDMKRFVLENFSGRVSEIPALAARIRQKFPDHELYTGPIDYKVKELLYHFNKDENAFFESWQRFRRLKKTFTKVNLLQDYGNLLAAWKPEQRIIFNLTDIFLGQNEVVRGLHRMRDQFNALRTECARFPELYLTGTDFRQLRYFGRPHELEDL